MKCPVESYNGDKLDNDAELERTTVSIGDEVVVVLRNDKGESEHKLLLLADNSKADISQELRDKGIRATSVSSPIGQAILDKTSGDVIVPEAIKGQEITIISISKDKSIDDILN